MLLYRFLRFLLRISVHVFFKEIQVMGQEQLPEKGPLIVAVNHPNTLMDPMVVALLLKQRSGFLANAGIFANDFLKWLFGRLHLIPVYRQQDVKAGEVADNRSSFRRCYDYLLKGGTLMIFPEGSSVHEMKLRRLKTGTARIALETAQLANFASGLRIVPVSLTYSDPMRFRSRLYVSISAPIAVDGLKAAYQTDPVGTVQQLTDTLRDKLQDQLVATNDKEEEVLLMRIRKLYRDHMQEQHQQLLTKEEEFRLLQQIAAGLAHYREHRPQEYEQLAQKVALYFEQLAAAGLKEGFLADSFSKLKQAGLLLSNIAFLLVLFPVYLLGLFTNYMPYLLPSKTASALGTDIEYRAGIMMLSGLLYFPLFYGLCLWVFSILMATTWYQVLLFGLSLPLLGYFVLYYWRVAEITRSLLNLMKLSRKHHSAMLNLISLRHELKLELEMAAAFLSSQDLEQTADHA